MGRACILSCFLVFFTASSVGFQTRFFRQNLDHFSFTQQSYILFNQKYLIESSFWHKGGPIFVYTGNEGNIEWYASNTGFLLDIAPKFRAMVVFIEHRFYGESMPPKSAETLGYLNSRQALADYGVLINSLKTNLSSEESPVVVFGGSYGGLLAAWFRLKYPHIVIGALASSAPILQFDNIVPSSTFYDIVSQDFKDVSLNCFEVIKRSWGELEVLSTTTHGVQEINKIFKTCRNLDFVSSTSDWLATAFVKTAMVNYPTAANFFAPLPAYPVKQMCKIIEEFPPGASNLERAFAAASLYYNHSGSETCFDVENYTDPHTAKNWGWQTCAEMVIPMSCSNQSMFPVFEYDEQLNQENCMKAYGVKSRPHWIATEYGGQGIETALRRFGSNIMFSNGLQDPWSRGGIEQHHCSRDEERASTKDDPEWLKDQRRQEVAVIEKWISEYHTDSRKQEEY